MNKRKAAQAPNLPMWSGYTQDERAALAAALPGISDADIDWLQMSVKGDELDINKLIPATRYLASEAARDAGTIRAALKIAHQRASEQPDDDGDWLPETTHAAQLAVKPLLYLLRTLEDKQAEHTLFAEELSSRKRSNRVNLMQRTLCDRVAHMWERAGGEVNNGNGYRKFFEAACRPPLTDRWVMRTRGAAWSEGTFKAHVASHQSRALSKRPQN